MRKRRQPKRWKTNDESYLDRKDHILRSFLSEVSRQEILTSEQLLDLIKRAQAGSTAARHKVGLCNCRLVVRIAKEFQSVNISINDLIQEGYIGLDDAITRYDPKRKVPFAHFASWWIKMRIMDYIWWYQTTVRIPESQRLAVNKLIKISAKFIAEHARVPSMEELLETSGLSEQKVQNYFNLFNEGNLTQSSSISAEHENTLSFIDNGPSPEETTDKNIVTEAITQCLDTLSEKHQEFLRDYYGLGRPAVPVGKMAEITGTTTENIRQKRARLIKYLQENCSEDLAPYAGEMNL